MKSRKLAIGIDPGTRTGLAVKDLGTGEFLHIGTHPIHVAWERVMNLHTREGVELYAVVEDARKRKWFADEDMSESRKRGKRMGAGSVKRDCRIWEDFLGDLGVPCRLEKPGKGKTKIDARHFARLTGYTGRTSEHARDAGMLVHGLNPRNLKLLFRD